MVGFDNLRLRPPPCIGKGMGIATRVLRRSDLPQLANITTPAPSHGIRRKPQEWPRAVCGRPV